MAVDLAKTFQYFMECMLSKSHTKHVGLGEQINELLARTGDARIRVCATLSRSSTPAHTTGSSADPRSAVVTSSQHWSK
eukprot:8886270-Pyramimonas_sp.AAC.2